MTQSTVAPKSMTVGEGGSALAFAALAMLSIIVAAKAYTPEYAFHAYLFAAVLIGGSMSGLFTAAFLRQIGRHADVYERLGIELVGRGAGITTHPELRSRRDGRRFYEDRHRRPGRPLTSPGAPMPIDACLRPCNEH